MGIAATPVNWRPTSLCENEGPQLRAPFHQPLTNSGTHVTDSVVGASEAHVQLGDERIVAEAGKSELVPDGDAVVVARHPPVQLLHHRRRLVLIRVRVWKQRQKTVDLQAGLGCDLASDEKAQT